jgi:hypothetical protein
MNNKGKIKALVEPYSKEYALILEASNVFIHRYNCEPIDIGLVIKQNEGKRLKVNEFQFVVWEKLYNFILRNLPDFLNKREIQDVIKGRKLIEVELEVDSTISIVSCLADTTLILPNVQGLVSINISEEVPVDLMYCS